MAIRVTRTIAEVAGTLTSTVRVTRVMAEVGGQAAQPDVRLYRIGMHALVEFSLGTSVSAQDTLTFSQAQQLSFPIAVAETVTFSQTGEANLTLEPELEQTVTFSQAIVEQPSINSSASNNFTFSQFTSPGVFSLSASDTLTFGHIAFNVGPTAVALADTITFTQVLSALTPGAAVQTVTFSQAGGGGVIIPGGIERVAGPQTVTFSQVDQKVLCKASAQQLTASDTVTFSDKGALPILLSIPQSFILTDAASPDYVYLIEHTITLTDIEPVPTLVRPLVITDTLSFGHAVGYINRIDLCQYTPTIGAATDPNAPAPPPGSISVTKNSTVTLSYPTVAPTMTVTIRAPEYGDVQRLNFDRVNRESRGGTLQIYSDPDWPKQEILVLQFTTLKESEAQDVLTFFKDTLGLEVKLVDWYGRTWHGFVTNPESPIVRSRRGIVDLSFEFEGEQQ